MRAGRGVSLVAVLVVLGAAMLATRSRAEVFYARDEALALAFPDDTAIESKTVFLTAAQVAAVKARAGLDLDSPLFHYYIGRREGAVVAYAAIETHVVRTLPETLLIVLTPDGVVERVTLLAFYEPREYMPSARWLGQFNGRKGHEGGWRVGHDVHGITGATLTANAAAQALRKTLVLYDLVMRHAGEGEKEK
jgi:hypothetical protein